MSTITELAIFKAAVDHPLTFSSVLELSLDRISDPQNVESLSAQEVGKKKAIKLFHMIWSGVTKYLKTVTNIKCKPLEFPGLGIFLPTLSERGMETQQMKLTEQALNNFDPSELDVKLLLSINFLRQCGSGVNVPESNSQEGAYISTYDPSLGEQVNIRGVHHLNLQAVAQVCETDMLSVEMILKEIVAQLKAHIKKGISLRVMFKVGKLIFKNGMLSWKPFNEDD